MNAGPTRIDAPSNPRIKAWAKLRDARERRRTGLFLAEGEHLAREALRASVPIETVLVRDGWDATGLQFPDAAEVILCSDRALRAVCETPSPQGVALVCRQPGEDAPSPGPGRWLLLDNLQDPGNVGSLIRTGHAAGVSGVILGDGCADPHAPKTLRSAQGSTFHLPVVAANLADWIDAARAIGVDVFTTAVRPGEGTSYRSLRPSRDWALLLGSEARGVDPALAACCTSSLHIPLPGGAESLGAAAAGAILLFHLAAGTPPESP